MDIKKPEQPNAFFDICFDSACFASVFKGSDFRKLRKPNAFFDILLDSACFASVSKGLGIRKCEKPNAFFVFLLVMHVLLQFLKGRIAGNLKNQMLSYMFFRFCMFLVSFFLFKFGKILEFEP